MWTIPFLPAIATYVAAGVSTVAAGLGISWQRSETGRARSRAKKSVAPVIREAAKFDKDMERWRKPVEEATVGYARQAKQELLRGKGLEHLREMGAANVRFGPLEDAGYASLENLKGLSIRELAALPGIGDKSAKKILQALAATEKEALRAGLPLPSADLESEESERLAAATLDLLDAKEQAGTDAARLRELGAEFSAERREVIKQTGFGKWLLTPFRRQKNAEARERAHALAAEGEKVVETGLLEKAKEGRKQLKSRKRTKRTEEAVRATFRDRYAACSAALDEIFVHRGLRPGKAKRDGRGGLTDEVAKRVEGFQLRAAGLRATLRPYQEFGAKFLLAQERTILGDEMGLGKTMQTLACMVHCSESDENARFFVVAPAGLLINWEREVEKFTDLKPHLLYGDELEENFGHWMEQGGVAITSYATLRIADIGALLEEKELGVRLCAVDEAHFIKNPQAGRTQAVRRLLDRSESCVLLSGTPMENKPQEFLELIDGIRPQDAADLRSANMELGLGKADIAEFHHAVSKIYLRRNQEDVLKELPDRLDVEEWISLAPLDMDAYHDMVRGKNFMGMRRSATLGQPDQPSGKLDRLAELLQEHAESGRKVLIFSFFLDVLAAIEDRFETVGTISGKLGPQAKQELCDVFQSAPGHGILLLQIQAGGQGLNLQGASAVVLMEPQLKPTIEDQAIARAHRMGQTRRVLVHRLLARGTCDETMMEILAKKSELFDAYARQSLVKEASPEATETQMKKAVLEAEFDRLRRAGGLERGEQKVPEMHAHPAKTHEASDNESEPTGDEEKGEPTPIPPSSETASAADAKESVVDESVVDGPVEGASMAGESPSAGSPEGAPVTEADGELDPKPEPGAESDEISAQDPDPASARKPERESKPVSRAATNSGPAAEPEPEEEVDPD